MVHTIVNLCKAGKSIVKFFDNVKKIWSSLFVRWHYNGKSKICFVIVLWNVTPQHIIHVFKWYVCNTLNEF